MSINIRPTLAVTMTLTIIHWECPLHHRQCNCCLRHRQSHPSRPSCQQLSGDSNRWPIRRLPVSNRRNTASSSTVMSLWILIRARPLNLLSAIELLCHVLSLRIVENDRSQQHDPTGSVISSCNIAVMFGNKFIGAAIRRAPANVVIRLVVKWKSSLRSMMLVEPMLSDTVWSTLSDGRIRVKSDNSNFYNRDYNFTSQNFYRGGCLGCLNSGYGADVAPYSWSSSKPSSGRVDDVSRRLCIWYKLFATYQLLRLCDENLW